MAQYTGLLRYTVLLSGGLLIGASAIAQMSDEPAAAPAAEPIAADTAGAPREQTPLRYVVKKGDTLWSISRHFLMDPWQWPEIWYVNGQLSNPHRIYPGDVLSLHVVDGHRQIERIAANPEGRLSPHIRSIDLGDSIPAIPMDAIRDFLRSPRVFSLDELKQAPYVLDFVEEHMIAGAGSKIYVRKLGDTPVRYSVARLGGRYVDPDSGDLLGYEAIPVGTSETQQPGDPGVALLTSTTRETRVGDYLLPPEQENYDVNFYPHPPKRKIDGRIISVFDGVTEVGQYQVVALNRGARDGLERGDVLTVSQTGRVARDPHAESDSAIRLPDQPAGLAMVFKVDQRLSYALLMETTRSVHVLDRVTNPVSGRR